MPDVDPLVGADLGQYHITQMLGKGGMATVYMATQSTINRIVAIKVLPRSFMHDDTFMQRFRREAELVARLEHFHILPIYDYGEYDGMPYIVMRFLDGGTLQQRIKQGPIPWEDCVKIVRQVADALDYAHTHNVIHRDIKPSNIMLDRQGNAYLTDFGIAKVSESTSQLTGSGIVGTPAYMAPEQTKQGSPKPAMDVYALGVTLFEMITGQVPFNADTPIAQILMHLQEPVPSLRDFNPEFPPEVDEILKKAMAKSPENRFARPSDLAKALEAVGARGGWSWTPGVPISTTQTIPRAIPGSANIATDAGRPSAAAPARVPHAPVSLVWIALGGLGFLLLIGIGLGVGAILGNANRQATLTPLPAVAQVSTTQLTEIVSAPTGTPNPSPTMTPTVTVAPAVSPTTLPGKTTLRGVSMVLVPAGAFIMGSDSGYPKERPAHEVFLSAYYIDLTEVTNLYYIACVQEGPCSPPINPNSRSRPSYFSTTFTSYHDFPVINVSWNQAQQYCEWRGGSLPTEAQWEKAARWDPTTGQSRTFPWDSMVLDDTHLNFDSHIGDTVKVGSYPRGASALGVLDMAGNVAEWVFDWYQDDYYEHSPHDNPRGPDTGQARVIRGGSYEDPGAQLTTTFRVAAGPATTDMTIGFRCAWTLGASSSPTALP